MELLPRRAAVEIWKKFVAVAELLPTSVVRLVPVPTASVSPSVEEPPIKSP